MLVVNGETVWVPSRRQELITGLKRMGVDKLDGQPLRNVSAAELRRVYCRERARVVRERQRRQPADDLRTYHQSFAAWSVTD